MKLDLTTDVVKVKFDVSLPAAEQTQNRVYKEYKFRVPKAMRGLLHEGDKVVVQLRDGSLQCCTVSEINVYFPNQDSQPLAYVVDRFSTAALEKQIEDEQKMAELRTRLEAKKQEFEKNALYEMLAEKDPEAAQMLAMLKEMGGVL